MNLRNGSACAKFILFGEHSIVTRGRAIGIPLPQLQMKVTLSESAGNESQLFGDSTFLKEMSIESNVPQSAGLGSSAALTVATARALLPKTASSDEIIKLAIRGESFFHLKTSGLDPTIIALERPLIFRSVPDPKVFDLNLDSFYKSDYFFALLHTGIPHKTRDVQIAVKRVKEETPLLFEDLMDALASNTESAIKALTQENFDELPRLMNDSHFRLMSLGVSNNETEGLLEELKKYPCFKAGKITGAGCGGYIVALFKESSTESRSAIREELTQRFSSRGPVLFAHP